MVSPWQNSLKGNKQAIHQVVGIENEARFIPALQEERSAVALAVFLFNDTSTAEEKVSYLWNVINWIWSETTNLCVIQVRLRDSPGA